MGALLQDLRYGLRMLRKNPGFTAVAVVTLGLGIGANTAIFSVVNAVLLRPLPYRDPGRLVMVWEQLRRLGLARFGSCFGDYFDYLGQNRVFEDIAAVEEANLDLTAGEEPERLFGMRASANLFPLLGVEPALGRSFGTEENQPGRDNVVLLSDSLWRRRFGADRGIIGKTISIDGNRLVIVGVMPQNFRFSVGRPESPQVWLPIAFRADPTRSLGRLQLIARRKPGVSLEQARSEMKTVAGRLEQEYHVYQGPHGEDAGYTVDVIPLRQEIAGDARSSLLVMFAAVGLVLLIACVNVANLFLARAAAREKDIAIRAALGATGMRLTAQLLTEGMMLAVLGGSLGLLLAIHGVDLLVTLSPYGIIRLLGVRIGGPVFGFTLLISLITGAIFALPSAIQVLRSPISDSLKRGTAWGAGASFLRRFPQVLVIAEVALSMVLVIGAGLLIRTFVALQNVDAGFRLENIMTARLSLPAFRYPNDSKIASFFQQVVERVDTLPGVISASATSSLPLAAGAGRDPFSIEGRPWREFDTATGTPQVASSQAISPEYFQTLQIPLLEGRDFSARDASGSPLVAMINATMSRGFWPTESPLGKHIVLGAPGPGAPWLTIVGVVGDVRTSGLDTRPWPQIYVPQAQSPSRSMALVIRTASDPLALASVLHRAVAALDKNLPLYGTATMEQLIADSVAPRRYNMLLMSLLAALATLLAAVGIYGVISYWVARRTRELGIQMALGATQARVLRLVIGQGMLLVLVGLIVGVVVAFGFTRFMSALLYGISPSDPTTFLSVPLLLTAVALLACYIPARRATKVDPIVALRYE